MIRKVEMERFTVTSSKPFDVVVAAIKALIGHPNTAELWQATQRATTAAELVFCPRNKLSKWTNQDRLGYVTGTPFVCSGTDCGGAS